VIAPLATAEIRLPLSSGSQVADPLAGLGTWFRFAFDGDLVDTGSREHTEDPIIVGFPTLETYASGFGYLLGNGAGITSTSSLLPASQLTGDLVAFTALFVLAQAPDDAAGGSGAVLSVPAHDSFPGLLIGVEKGFPYFESGVTTIRADAELPASASRLAVYVAPTEDGAFVQFYLDDQPAGNGTFGSTLFQTQPGAGSVSGPDGYVAIFDELRIFEGAYPAFNLSEQAAKGKALVSATGFEGGILGPGFATEGDSVELEHGRLILGTGSRLIIGPSGIPPQGTSLTFNHTDGKAVAAIELANGSSLDIDTDGTLWLDGIATGFNVGIHTPSNLTVSIEPTEAGLLVYSSDESWVLLDDTTPAVDAAWSLSSSGEEPVVVSNVSLSILKSTLASSHRLRLLSNASRPETLNAAVYRIPQEVPGPVPASPAPTNIDQ
jgi:hypothetical protein